MAAITDELMLLERVFLRLGSAATDEQLEIVLGKFLPPVLLKLSSPQEVIRKKVMELLIHVNKRMKSRPTVQLPVEVLLNQYQNPGASSFVTNFTIIYIRSGFSRLPTEKQIKLVPDIISVLQNKPTSHIDSLLLLIIPLLGKVHVLSDPEKAKTFFGINQNSTVFKHFLDILLDILLLPYSSLSLYCQELESNQASAISVPIPPGMSEASFKRVTINNSMKPEEFESIKLGIIKFLSQGVSKPEDVLTHFIIAASDTRFEVANLADLELKKLIGFIDWSSVHISQPLFQIFLGVKSTKTDQIRIPANTRIKLKLLIYLCRFKGEACLFPHSLQVIFDCLYGENTNSKLKKMALNFTANLIRYAVGDSLRKISPVLLVGLTKLIKEGENEHQGQAYITIGMLAQTFPHIVFDDVGLLELYLNNLELASPSLKIHVREGLLQLILAYKYDIFPKECDKDGRLGILLALIKVKISSQDIIVRFACVRILASIFPPDYVPSKFLLLIAIGDRESDVCQEAFRSIYNTTRKNDFGLPKVIDKNIMPSFPELTRFVYNETQINMNNKINLTADMGSHPLPFKSLTYLEILLYLRLCFLKNIDVPLTRDVFRHPCVYTPKIVKILQDIYNESSSRDCLLQFTDMLRSLLLANPETESFLCMNELIGCVPQLHTLIINDLNWIRSQMFNVKEEVREQAAVLYSLVLSQKDNETFNSAVKYLIEQTKKNGLEFQHGSLLGIGTCLEMYALKKKRNNEKFDQVALVKECLYTIITFLKNKNPLLIGTAVTSIGLIGRVINLPLNEEENNEEGSPHPKKAAVGTTYLQLVEMLLAIMNDSKLSAKVREKSARCLGLICAGEKLVHIRLIIQGLLNTAKETKDIEVHFTIGESLLMCCQTISSPEARDVWLIMPDCYTDNSEDPIIDENLDWCLEKLLTLARQPHPNSKQASSIWLLALIKGCGTRAPIAKRVQILQNTFMSYLSENSDIIQDVASKGLCVIYDLFKSDDILTSLVNQLTLGTRNVKEVTSNTNIFEDGQLGSTPTGENLTTYKELCSLASDLNKPDLIYQFMHLANHNAIWNSKKGAAFGFSSIAERCGEDLKKIMPEIIPKLYRYQFDPTPSIYASMSNIWRVLVSEPQNALDTYYHDILKDLLQNLNSSQYRVRLSCSLALQDFLKGSANRSIHDAVDYMDELWSKLFRVMDDHHEATRLSANRTAKILSKLCIRGSNNDQGKAGIKLVEAILPVFLITGITHTVGEIRITSLQTISELIDSAGDQVKPFLPKLIPALLQATGELESSKLSYLSTMMGAQAETQEVIDSARASIAKSHFATETVTKSLRYVDSTMLDELIPKVLELIKSSVGLGTRIACAHFISLLVVHLGIDLQRFGGKILFGLLNGLTDRNSAIRKHNAVAIGHVVAICKPTSLDKLFAKLQTWYFEKEDDSVRSAIAVTIQSIGNHNQDCIRQHAKLVLPLVFFAIHSEKSPATQRTLELWTDIWSEHSPGTENGIRQNIEEIITMLQFALESSSWTVKAQAANSIATVASKLGSSMEAKYSDYLLNTLLVGLKGKTWQGKHNLLKALSSLCSNCNDKVKANKENPTLIIQSVCREATKQEITYKISAVKCLGDVVSALEIDSFEPVYEIVKSILNSNEKVEEEEEDTKENRENIINLKIAAYETLGKAWPEHNSQTQEKYGELFVNHCVDTISSVTRAIQVSILTALYNFVNKFILLGKNVLTDNEDCVLDTVIDKLLQALTYSLGISRHTKLRKEALNIVFCLGTKLKQKNISEVELEKLIALFSAALPNLSTDIEPEIKCRLNDIKQLLY